MWFSFFCAFGLIAWLLRWEPTYNTYYRLREFDLNDMVAQITVCCARLSQRYGQTYFSDQRRESWIGAQVL